MKAEKKEIWKFILESYGYLLGLAIDAGKDRGWKGYLFLWPFLGALVIVIYLFGRNFVS